MSRAHSLRVADYLQHSIPQYLGALHMKCAMPLRTAISL
jgi:hypothetical protein